MRESPIEKRLVEDAGAEGWKSIKMAKTECRGRPDRLFYRKSVTKFIEVKAPGKFPTRQQFKRMEELRIEGFDADWCDSVEGGLAILRR